MPRPPAKKWQQQRSKQQRCSLICEPLYLKPRNPDGSLDEGAQGQLSFKWYKAVLHCDAGDGKRAELLVPQKTVSDGDLAVGALGQIRYALCQLSRGGCSCGASFHRLGRVLS